MQDIRQQILDIRWSQKLFCFKCGGLSCLQSTADVLVERERECQTRNRVYTNLIFRISVYGEPHLMHFSKRAGARMAKLAISELPQSTFSGLVCVRSRKSKPPMRQCSTFLRNLVENTISTSLDPQNFGLWVRLRERIAA